MQAFGNFFRTSKQFCWEPFVIFLFSYKCSNGNFFKKTSHNYPLVNSVTMTMVGKHLRKQVYRKTPRILSYNSYIRSLKDAYLRLRYLVSLGKTCLDYRGMHIYFINN